MAKGGSEDECCDAKNRSDESNESNESIESNVCT